MGWGQAELTTWPLGWSQNLSNSVRQGLAFKYQGKEDEAIKACEEESDLDPNNAKAWFYKGEAWGGASGNSAEADKQKEAMKAKGEEIKKKG